MTLAQWEKQSRNQRRIDVKKEIALIFRIILRLEEILSVMADIVPRSNIIGTDAISILYHCAEFDITVTQCTRVWGFSLFIRLDKGGKNFCIKLFLKIEDMKLYPCKVGSLLGTDLMNLMVARFGVEFHVNPLHVIPLFFKEQGRNSRIDPSAHPDQYFFTH